MKFVFQVLKEQSNCYHLIMRLAIYDAKSSYQMHYLGILWQFLNPISQILVFWVIFGLGIRGGDPVGEIPFFIWLVVGLIPWFFISPSIIQGSNSVYSSVNLVAKMKFPLSVLPTITIVKHSFNFVLMLILLGVCLVIYGINPGVYLLQLIYYIFALFLFLFAITLFCSTISTLVRDFQVALQSLMRVLFFLTPILWDGNSMPEKLNAFLKLNPLYYLVEGFRNTFLGTSWFYEDITYTVYFWLFTFLILTSGAFLHFKFRKKFVDYI